jgi:hypothetical protein
MKNDTENQKPAKETAEEPLPRTTCSTWVRTTDRLPGEPGEQTGVLMWSSEWATWLKGMVTRWMDGSCEWSIYNQQDDRYHDWGHVPEYWMSPILPNTTAQTPPNSGTKTVQTTNVPAVDLPRLVRLSDAEKYADPSGPRRMIGCSQERVEEQLRIALDGHPDSELWGENGLIAATMRAARMTMDALPGKLVAFDCLENTLGFRMEEMPSAATLGQRVYLCLPNAQHIHPEPTPENVTNQ